MNKTTLLSLVLGLCFLGRVFAQAPIDPATAAALTPDELKEFQSWVGVGVGGLPHTLEGYRTLQRLNKKLADPLDTKAISLLIGHGNDVSTVGSLPRRAGPKPTVAPFAIPHRQTDQRNSPEIRQQQVAIFARVVAGHDTEVEFRKSYFEKNNDAVFVKNDVSSNPDIRQVTHAEVGHVHPIDGSMHMTLSPSDAKEVIEKGWGELHGLYGQVFNGTDALSKTYMMIYSPRDSEELAVTEKILRGAIAYAVHQTAPK